MVEKTQNMENSSMFILFYSSQKLYDSSIHSAKSNNDGLRSRVTHVGRHVGVRNI